MDEKLIYNSNKEKQNLPLCRSKLLIELIGHIWLNCLFWERVAPSSKGKLILINSVPNYLQWWGDLQSIFKVPYGAGILKDKTMAIQFVFIPNDEKQNYSICRSQLKVETFGHSTSWINQSNSIEVPKVVKPANEKT